MSSMSQTQKAHLQEKIAKGVIWFFVILTLLVLAWIIFYVLYRGFVSDNHVYYQVADTTETAPAHPDYPEAPITFVIHRKVRVKDDVTSQELFDLYTKRRQPNWGDITGQNLDVELFALSPATDAGKGGEKIILQGRDDYSKNVTILTDPEELLQRVSETAGAIGFLPADLAESTAAKIKTIPLRRIAAPVHPSVRAIENNIQLQEITQKDLEAIFQGRISNWNELGGIDMPIVPVAMTEKSGLFGTLLPRLLGDNPDRAEKLITADSLAGFYRHLESTPGAVGITYWSSLGDFDRTVVSFTRREVRRNLDWHFLVEEPARSGKWGGISTIIINTFFLIIFTLLFSTPIGVLGAIYMVEYAKQNRMMRILRLGTETLAGIPSIVFGLFGFIFFVDMLGMGIGFISATLTVTMMVLPTIIRTSEEALKSVPLSFREGSLSLGATKFQTIMKVVLPAATPGILTGIILAVGRTVGETAVLIYTLGSNYELVRGPSSSARVLSLHLYSLFSEAISFDRSFATGAILIFIILLVNYSTTSLIGQLNRKAGK